MDASDKDPNTTLRTLSEQALFNTYPDEQNLAVEKKLERYRLFCKINNGEQDLTPEEVVLLKFVIGKSYNALAVGRAFDIIEPIIQAVPKENGVGDPTDVKV